MPNTITLEQKVSLKWIVEKERVDSIKPDLDETQIIQRVQIVDGQVVDVKYLPVIREEK